MTCGVWFRGGDRWKKPRVEQRRAVCCTVGRGLRGDDAIEKSMCQKHVVTRKHLAMSQNVLQKPGFL